MVTLLVAMAAGIFLDMLITRRRFGVVLRQFIDYSGMDAVVNIVLLIALYHLLKPSDDALIDYSVLFAVIISFGVQVICTALRRLIQNRLEDSTKLESDSARLIKKYNGVRRPKEEGQSADDWNRSAVRAPDAAPAWYAVDATDEARELLKWERGKQGRGAQKVDTSCGLICFPEIVDYYLTDMGLDVDDNRSRRYAPPAFVGDHWEELLSAHGTSDIYNQENIRVDLWEEKDGNLVIHTGRTTYYDSMATNRAMDYRLACGVSVREMLQYGPFVPDLGDSLLSNHLGFNGLVETSDGKIPLVLRGKHVSIGKDTLGPSIGASMKTAYALDAHGSLTAEGVMGAIRREMQDELKIPAEALEGDGNGIELLAAYRDIVEGNKPQLLFYAHVGMTSQETCEKFYGTLQGERRERGLFRHDRRHLEDGDTLVWIERDDLLDRTWVVPGAVKTRVLTADSHHMERGPKAPSQDYKKEMVPSAGLTIAIVQSYLKGRQDDKAE